MRTMKINNYDFKGSLFNMDCLNILSEPNLTFANDLIGKVTVICNYIPLLFFKNLKWCLSSKCYFYKILTIFRRTRKVLSTPSLHKFLLPRWALIFFSLITRIKFGTDLSLKFTSFHSKFCFYLFIYHKQISQNNILNFIEKKKINLSITGVKS